mgnify:CR=1 FL=1
MPVNLPLPQAADLHPVAGVRIGVTEAGVRKANRKDVSVFLLDEGTSVAGVFTQNRYCAAPVQVCREHLAGGQGVRALLINTGNANAGTGADGLARTRATCAALAQELGVAPTQILPFSTGVIMEPLPVERITAGLPAAIANAQADHWLAAAEGIMTTDTQPKAYSRQVTVDGKTVTVTGISKGAGMIRPNMATMLGFLATDAAIAPALLQGLARELAEGSFNRVTIDGDTSTNDSFIVMATHQAGNAPITDWNASADAQALKTALQDVARLLAQAIVRDGEGATKFITVQVDGGQTEEECRLAAYAIAHSPLVKTAFFASDPNLGRIGLRGHCRPGPKPHRAAPGRCARGHPGRAQPGLPRRRRPARDEAKRNHRARPPGPWPGQPDGVDLRFQPRLRDDQRRLPLLRTCSRSKHSFN